MEWIASLCRLAWGSTNVPGDWKRGIILPIYHIKVKGIGGVTLTGHWFAKLSWKNIWKNSERQLNILICEDWVDSDTLKGVWTRYSTVRALTDINLKK